MRNQLSPAGPSAGSAERVTTSPPPPLNLVASWHPFKTKGAKKAIMEVWEQFVTAQFRPETPETHSNHLQKKTAEGVL